MIEGDHMQSQNMSTFCWSIKVSLCCKHIYGPWIVSSGKKSNTITIGLNRQKIWSTHIFLFQTFDTENRWNQNLCLVELIVIFYFIFAENPV